MLVKELEWGTKKLNEHDTVYGVFTDIGRFTVLHRLPDFDDATIDIETGYLDLEDNFFLAGYVDIRNYPDLTLEEVVALIKRS